jgi:adenosylcobinamide amidohydrolase
MIFRFKNGDTLNLSEYPGLFEYEGLMTHFGQEIADRIFNEIEESYFNKEKPQSRCC